ncbi:hypothetical protein EIP86_006364 [Pleurotus ostreatoroseus]|nr:hypothetical protein EIP86_006364 [Pleurotus ostreatoroseus]
MSSPAFPLNFVPSAVRPYLELIRIEKPTGTVLMFWPFAWGLSLAAYRSGMPLPQYAKDLCYYLVGAAIIRGAACTVNDIMDRKFDAGVERTKSRPLPSGRVSVPQALLWLVAQYVIGAVYFGSRVQDSAFIAAMIQMLPLLSIYPLLKRVTHWPQAYLGIGMNFGLIVSWLHASSTMDLKLMVCMLIGCWCWTMEYDTVYACQDRKDDIKVGVNSTAVLFGDHVLPFLKINAVVFVGLLVYVGKLNEQGPIYYALACFGSAAWLVWQFFTLDLDSPKSCWDAFMGNGRLGWVIWGGIALDYVAKWVVHEGFKKDILTF